MCVVQNACKIFLDTKKIQNYSRRQYLTNLCILAVSIHKTNFNSTVFSSQRLRSTLVSSSRPRRLRATRCCWTRRFQSCLPLPYPSGWTSAKGTTLEPSCRTRWATPPTSSAWWVDPPLTSRSGDRSRIWGYSCSLGSGITWPGLGHQQVGRLLIYLFI